MSLRGFALLPLIILIAPNELFEEFGGSFIEKLDLSVQENFAYKNAQKMLQ